MFWNLFKRIPKPYKTGFLPPQDGHVVSYYAYGNPNGIPVLSFHGGPGGSAKPKYARLFDLKKYHFIQMDQRGCGQSQAHDSLFHNDTDALLSDAYRVLQQLEIKEKIIAHGASWGSTLALLFAEKYPNLVQKIVVSSVFLARPIDAAWVNRDSIRFYPDLWAQMRKQVRTEDIHQAYRRLLFSNKTKDNLKALSYLGSYEYMLGQLDPHFEVLTALDEAALKSARIYFYYEQNNFFLSENQILAHSGKIKQIPALIVHNRMDFCCPPQQAWDLHCALPKSKLVLVAGRGHSSPELLKITKKEIRDFLKEA